MNINFDEFKSLFHPIQGNSAQYSFDGMLIERKNAPIMQVLAAAHDERVCTLSFEHDEAVIRPGMSFQGAGYFITEVPVTERINVVN